jgi:DNA-directed RNA polymerase specialized sigma24 family protein
VKKGRRRNLDCQRMRLANALATLPEHPWTVYLLHARDGMAFDQIAVRLGIMPEAVVAHLADALAALSRLLDEPGP